MQTKSPGIALKALIALAFAGSAGLAQAGVYGGVGAGQGDNSVTDDEDTAWKVFGGWEYNETFGVEAGYFDLGETEVGIFSQDVQTVYVDGLANLPFTPNFGAFGKVGGHYAQVDTTPGTEEEEFDLTYGAGLRYEFMEGMSVRGEWERFEIPEGEVDALTASVVFGF